MKYLGFFGEWERGFAAMLQGKGEKDIAFCFFALLPPSVSALLKELLLFAVDVFRKLFLQIHILGLSVFYMYEMHLELTLLIF